MQIKVVWIHSHFLYPTGGTKFILEVAKRLAKKLSLLILVEEGNPQVLENFRKAGVKVKTFGFLTSNNPFYWIFLPIFLFFELAKVKNLAKDANVVISSMFPANYLANRTGILHIQYCFEPFAFFYDDEFVKGFSLSKRVFIKILKFFYSKFERGETLKTDKILTLNDVTAYWVKRVYKRDAVITQGGVDTGFFKKTDNKSLLQKYKNQKLVIHSTDYSPVKGTDLVISAFAKVVKKLPEAKLLITTTIEDREAQAKLTELAKNLGVGNKIEFLGFLPYKLLPAYYSQALVYVSGSSSSKSGTTSMNLPVKEAMACGTPAIRAPVTKDDVEDGVSGFLVDPKDSDKLAEKIIFLLKNKKISEKMGEVARNKIVAIFNWDKVAKVFLEEIANLQTSRFFGKIG